MWCAAGLTFTRGAAAGSDPKYPVVFAVIGEYGTNDTNAAAVATLVNTVIQPQFVVTVGNNNYGDADLAGYDLAVGQFYSPYIGNYVGTYGTGSVVNRFFPAVGYLDWNFKTGYDPFLNYFTLPDEERAYTTMVGPVHLFVVNSDVHEPAGRTADSVQSEFIRLVMEASPAPWMFVFMQQSPFSSGDTFGSDTAMRWPFKQWGADAVFSGNNRNFERLDIAGVPYFVNGAGGAELQNFSALVPQSKFRFSDFHGAIKVIVNAAEATVQFWSVENGGTLVHSHIVPATDPIADIIHPTSSWKYLDDGSDQGTAWREIGFDDSTWLSGRAQLGYGEGDELTAISSGPDPKNPYTTSYLRHSFQVSDPLAFSSLELSLLRDDGAIVYLNGVEVIRSNMPPGPVTFTTPAVSEIIFQDQNNYFAWPVDACLLHAAPLANVLAVEVHQASATDGDMGFDLFLTPKPRLPLTVRCVADISPSCGDGVVDGHDLQLLLSQLGRCLPFSIGPAAPLTLCAADLDRDGFVDGHDLRILLHALGTCP